MVFNFNRAIDLVALLIIFLVVLAIIWNGINGKGYKVSYKAPPINTTTGIITRIILLIATVICFLALVSLKSGGFTSHDTRQIILWSAIAFVAAIAYGAFARSGR